VLVVSKGDDRLLELDCREAWHFPSSRDGTYIGYHPPDSEWAIEQLELARSRGAEYLLVPAASFWWLEHYRGFARYVEDRYPLVARDEESCAIFALVRQAALYGRASAAEVRRHELALGERART
jgi:hypothetical protein